jgi:hypothetical protein
MVVRVFENLKISGEDKKTIIDDPRGGFNPALEVRIKQINGTITTRYIFERYPDYAYPEDRFLLRYHKPIRDYISDVQVVRDGNVVTEKTIEVNHGYSMLCIGVFWHFWLRHIFTKRLNGN